MSDNIPFDIQREIIKKVPDVRSLLRFRSVSKQWKSLIDSSDFIASYGARDTQPRRLLLRYQFTGYISRIQIQYDSFIDEVSFPLKLEGSSPKVPRRVYMLNDSIVIGSSCGLWSFDDYTNYSVAIWNPSLRKVVRILVPNNTSGKIAHFGFGVSPSTYDPTIVAIWYSPFVNVKTKVTDPWKVDVFTLSSKTWKMIPTSNLPRESVKLMRSSQVTIDRFIFFAACDVILANDDVSVFKNLILSFDLITHEFKEIHLPVSITNNKFRKISLSELNGSLVVSAYTNMVNGGRVYGVWMMMGEEAGVMTSFTKLFNIKIHYSSSRMTLLGFRKSGQPIMETWKTDQESAEESVEESAEESVEESAGESAGKSAGESAEESAEESADESAEEFAEEPAEEFAALEVYEPWSKQINDLGIKGEKESLFMFPYKETLLFADHSDGCIISNDY